MLAAINTLIHHAIIDRIFPGGVVGIITPQQERIILPFGHFTYEQSAPKVEAESIYDVASITKVIPTSFLALQLIDKGKLKTTNKVNQYIPELSFPGHEEVTIWHLLTHTVDYNLQLSTLKNLSPEKLLAAIFSTPLKSPLGSTFCYANANSILLGLVIERIYQKRLAVIAQQELFQPLYMEHSSFSPQTDFKQESIVPTEFDPWRQRLLQGETHDESAFVLSKIMTPGSAGLFSTVPDILNFLEMLLHQGNFDGKNFLSPTIINQMFTNQIGNINQYSGLGIDLCQPGFMGTTATPKTWGKTGFTGCYFVGNNEKQAALVFLCNHVHPQRNPNRNILHHFRATLSDIVFKSL